MNIFKGNVVKGLFLYKKVREPVVSRVIASRILREETKKMSSLSVSLMDMSKINHPDEYDCSRQINSIIKKLKEVKKRLG